MKCIGCFIVNVLGKVVEEIVEVILSMLKKDKMKGYV